MTYSLVPEIQMKDGRNIPRLAFGTWPLKGQEAVKAVRNAIELGYRLIDTAESYENEDALGEGIRASGVPREQLFITTKFNKEWHSRNGVRIACESSLRKLGVDYIDLYLIHWPNPQQDRYVEAFEGMTDLVDAGLIRSAGVSNFKPSHLERLLSAGLFPHVNQIQLDPQRPRNEDVAFHEKHDIVTQAWSPLDSEGKLLAKRPITSIAQEMNLSPAQIVLRWHLQRGYVPIARSGNPQRQRENINIFGFELNNEQMRLINALTNENVAIYDSDTFGH
jgi:2,5-diketo-D-gluconate reductase A